MTCPACANEVPAGARFCPDCGQPQSARCPACGEPHEPGQRFCASCGTPLAAAPAPAPAAAPVVPVDPSGSAGTPPPVSPTVAAPAELRHVSVLFCDLVGYTTMSEGRDPEEVRQVLSGYFELARGVVDRYGGSVEKFIGDAVMAVWGSEASHENDAERAVRAALELVTEVARFGEEVARMPGLAARVGVATGQAATVINPDEGIVVGDRVNVAARVQAAAEPGTVFVDAETREVTAAKLVLEDRGEHELKGRAEPVRLWRAVRPLATTDAAADGLEPAFVGRDRELALVKERFHVASAGHAERVSVSGHAGLGKSRLHREFRSYVDGLARMHYFHVGRCLSYGDGVTYWALAEMVRQRFGVAEADPEDRVRERVHERVPEIVREPFARPIVERAVSALLGVGGESVSRDELFAGWRLLFEQLGRQHPVVLVFEDLQWADADLLDFIEQVTDWSADHPIFVLTLARPELLESRPSWSAARRNVTPLMLEPLPDDAIGTILDDLVEMPDDLRARIVDRADGIPLYAVEMVRVLVDRGQAQAGADGRRRVVGEVGELDVPATLTALAAARLDVLAPDERLLVRDLSIFGGGFPRDAVTAMTTLPDDRASAAVAGLLRKGVLALRTDPLSPDRGQLAFEQVILRTTALESLPRNERVARHLRAARHLRSAFPDDGEEVAELIARHYRDAHDLAPEGEDASEAVREAGAMFLRAGRRSQSLGASEAALRSYLAARECLSDPQELATLAALALEVAFRCGRYDTAEELAETAEPDLRALGREREANHVALLHGRIPAQHGDVSGSVERLEAALERAAGSDADRAAVLASLGMMYQILDHRQASLDAVEEAMAIAEAQVLPEVLAKAAMSKAMLLSLMGRHQEALAISGMSVDLLAEHGSLADLAVAKVNRGELLVHDDRPGSRAHADEIILLARQVGDRVLEGLALANRSLQDVLLGRWDDVIAACGDTVGTSSPLQYEHGPMVMVSALRGDLQEAERRAALIDIPEGGSDDPQLRSAVWSTWGFLALGRGQRAEAADLLLRASRRPPDGSWSLRSDGPRYAWPMAVELAVDLGDPAQVADAVAVVADEPPGAVPPFLAAVLDFTRGRIAARDGDHATAEELMTAALARFEGFGYAYWHARCRVILAEWLASQGRTAAATTELQAAQEVLEPLGAVLDLARLERVRGHLGRAEGAVAG